MKILSSQKIQFTQNKIELFSISCATKTDYKAIKNFVLQQYELLPNKSFFIIDDINTELPFLFNNKNGRVYIATHNNHIIALQTVSFLNNNQLQSQLQHQSIFLSNNYVEFGWTMVAPDYRKKGIAINLSRKLEEDLFNQTESVVYVATVHPQNINSLYLYFKLGYIGLELHEHFGLPRLFLVKSNGVQTQTIKGTEILIGFSDQSTLKQSLNNGYICASICADNNNYFYKLRKACITPINDNVT